MLTETIVWRDVADELPDDGDTVLMALPALFDSDDVFAGFREAGNWYFIDASPVTDDPVTHWASMPAGPGGAK